MRYILSFLSAKAAIRYVLPIVLLINVSSVFAKVIEPPRSIEAPPLQSRQVRPELGGGSLHSGKLRSQHFLDGSGVARPIAGNGIKPRKRTEDGGAKFYGSGSQAGLAFTLDGKYVAEPMREEADHQQGDETECPFLCIGDLGKPEDHLMWWLLVGGIIVLMVPVARVEKPKRGS